MSKKPNDKEDALELAIESAKMIARANKWATDNPPPLATDRSLQILQGGVFPSGMGTQMQEGNPPAKELPHVVTGKRTEYVCGFLFDRNFDFVALVKKSKPAWQVGLLNGIGGKVEPLDRDHNEAMEREFNEETGVVFTKWIPFLTLHVQGIDVQFFCGHAEKRMALKGIDDEPVGWYQTDATFMPPTIPNLTWLIPMAMLKLQRPDWSEKSILVTS
jgi:8-oxo-dGTP pyrophosphatase MutT (NUDIX family)